MIITINLSEGVVITLNSTLPCQVWADEVDGGQHDE